jgi:hypothetical protein
MVTLILPLGVQGNAKKGKELAIKMEKSQTGFKGEESEMEMILINAKGEQIKRKMESKTLEVKSDGDKSIITFLWPADVKGTKMLTWSHKEGSDDQWLYLPAIKRVKRISSRNKSGSFMGSEFSFEDLGSQEIEKYNFFLESENKKTWTLKRVPKEENSGYSKQVLTVDKKMLTPLKIEYFDRKKELLKVANFSDYKKIKGFWRVTTIKMDNVQTGKKSILNWKKRKLKMKFADKVFSKNRLKR